MRFPASKALVPLAFIVAACISGCGGAPDIVVSNASDPSQVVHLSSFRGKVVVIDFWATWCGPCKMTMPTVEKLYNNYSSKGVEFMGISSDTSSEIQHYREANDITYPMYIDRDSLAAQLFGVEGIPHLIVVDKAGKVVQVEEGAPLNEEEVRKAIESSLAG
jgi:thiol-disulfide isomerase/thioredoxin